MDLNGDFRAGAERTDATRTTNESLSTRFRAAASNDVCGGGGGGGDRANFQLQSISMTPDGQVGRGTHGETDGRTEDSVGIIGRLWMREKKETPLRKICWFSGTATRRRLQFHGIVLFVIVIP